MEEDKIKGKTRGTRGREQLNRQQKTEEFSIFKYNATPLTQPWFFKSSHPILGQQTIQSLVIENHKVTSTIAEIKRLSMYRFSNLLTRTPEVGRPLTFIHYNNILSIILSPTTTAPNWDKKAGKEPRFLVQIIPPPPTTSFSYSGFPQFTQIGTSSFGEGGRGRGHRASSRFRHTDQVSRNQYWVYFLL